MVSELESAVFQRDHSFVFRPVSQVSRVLQTPYFALPMLNHALLVLKRSFARRYISRVFFIMGIEL